MSDRDIKAEEDHKDIHDEGGDDEVRAGSFYNLPTLETPTRFARGVTLKSLEGSHAK